ncbi:MAG: twin-arginine translocase TatA/TatE family subunit [Chloroflexi bacterium]|nr:twin-arginine translocase TatA/TatE family subunit [Chloroflexota bacterium]
MLPHLGPTELIIILVIVIIIFGAGKLPEIGGALGKGIREFKTATKEAQEASEEIEEAASEDKPAKDA